MSQAKAAGRGPGAGAVFAASALLAAGRAVARLLPAGVRRGLEHRFFGAVFQVTRVTNDAYGWRPSEPGGRGDGDRPTG